MAPRSIVRLVASSSLAALAALALAGCLGNNAVGIDGNAGAGTLACTPGQILSSELCSANGCATGRVAGRLCLPDRTLGPCGCYDSGSVTPPPASVCSTGSVRYGGPGSAVVACRADCASGQLTSETCVNNAWVDCRCHNPSPGGGGCVPNSIAPNSCGGLVCPAGWYAGRQCESSGMGYGGCMCFASPGGGTAQCTPGYERVCVRSCAEGQRPREVCNAAGTWDACQCLGTAATSQVCIPGSTSGSCTCPGAVTTGTRICNGAGTGYDCSSCTTAATCTPGQLYSRDACVGRLSCPSGQSSLQQCNAAGQYGDCQCGVVGGGAVNTSACRTQSFNLILRSTNSALRVRCWDMNGTPVTSLTNELRYTFSGGCGTLHCVDGTGEGASFVESGYWSTSRSGYMSERFDIIVVEGRDASLRNQQSLARICPDGARSKGNVAVNEDRLGQCNW